MTLIELAFLLVGNPLELSYAADLPENVLNFLTTYCAFYFANGEYTLTRVERCFSAVVQPKNGAYPFLI